MIRLTRMNGMPFVLNAELIETVDSTPDTIITLTTHQKLLVREDTDEVVSRVLEYRRAIAHPPLVLMSPRADSSPRDEHGQ